MRVGKGNGYNGVHAANAVLTSACSLTLLSSVVSNGYTSKRSAPYCSNPPFYFFDIRALWRSRLSARVPECRKIKKGGLDQYGAERFGRLIHVTIRKSAGLKGLSRSRVLSFCRFSVLFFSSQLLYYSSSFNS